MNELTTTANYGSVLNPLLDDSMFDKIERVAMKMAASSLLPETITHTGRVNERERLPQEVVEANCFLIANQAFKWKADPFAVAAASSVVHGRLMFEGKLVAAILDANLGIKLKVAYGKWDPTNEVCLVGEAVTNPDDLAIVVYEDDGSGGIGRRVDGCVKFWKTTGNGSPWREGGWRRQLHYRGTREWTRLHEPAVMVGVITDDEFDPAMHARDITPASERRAPAQSAKDVMAEIRAAKSGGQKTEIENDVIDQEQGEQSVSNERSSNGADPDPGQDGSALDTAEQKQAATSSQAPASEDGEGTGHPSSSQTSKSSPSTSSSDKKETGTPTQAEKETGYIWLHNVAKMLWAATNPGGDIKVLEAQRTASVAAYPIEGIHKYFLDKAGSIFGRCSDVIKADLKPGPGRKMIAALAGVEPDDIGPDKEPEKKDAKK